MQVNNLISLTSLLFIIFNLINLADSTCESVYTKPYCWSSQYTLQRINNTRNFILNGTHYTPHLFSGNTIKGEESYKVEIDEFGHIIIYNDTNTTVKFQRFVGWDYKVVDIYRPTMFFQTNKTRLDIFQDSQILIDGGTHNISFLLKQGHNILGYVLPDEISNISMVLRDASNNEVVIIQFDEDNDLWSIQLNEDMITTISDPRITTLLFVDKMKFVREGEKLDNTMMIIFAILLVALFLNCCCLSNDTHFD